MLALMIEPPETIVAPPPVNDTRFPDVCAVAEPTIMSPVVSELAVNKLAPTEADMYAPVVTDCNTAPLVEAPPCRLRTPPVAVTEAPPPVSSAAQPFVRAVPEILSSPVAVVAELATILRTSPVVTIVPEESRSIAVPVVRASLVTVSEPVEVAAEEVIFTALEVVAWLQVTLIPEPVPSASITTSRPITESVRVAPV